MLGMILDESEPVLTGGAPRSDRTIVLLDGGRGDLDAKPEEFSMDAFGAPEEIFLGQWLDQGNCFGRQPGTTAAITRFEFLEESETVALPAEDGIEFEDQEDFLPISDSAGEKDEPETVRLGEDWLLT